MNLQNNIKDMEKKKLNKVLSQIKNREMKRQLPHSYYMYYMYTYMHMHVDNMFDNITNSTTCAYGKQFSQGSVQGFHHIPPFGTMDLSTKHTQSGLHG